MTYYYIKNGDFVHKNGGDPPLTDTYIAIGKDGYARKIVNGVVTNTHPLVNTSDDVSDKIIADAHGTVLAKRMLGIKRRKKETKPNIKRERYGCK